MERHDSALQRGGRKEVNIFLEKIVDLNYCCSRKHFCGTTCLKEFAMSGSPKEAPFAVLGNKTLSVSGMHISSQFLLSFELTNQFLFTNQ